MVKGRVQLRHLRRPPERDSGAILLLALLFLGLLGIVSTTVMQTGTLQMRMALNEQLQVEAMQDARALARALTAITANFRLDQPVGTARCPVSSLALGCDLGGLQLPPYQAVAHDARIDYRVIRQGPEIVQAPPLHFAQDGEPGAPELRAAMFEIQVQVDGSEVGLGSAEAIRGVLLPLPDAAEQQSHQATEEMLPAGIAQAVGVYWRYPRFDPL